MVAAADPVLARLIECHNLAQSLLESTMDSLKRERRQASRALAPRIYAAYMEARMYEHIATIIYDETSDDTTWADARADANAARQRLDDLFNECLRAGIDYEDTMAILDRAEAVIRHSSSALAGLPLERIAELQVSPSPISRYLREAVKRCQAKRRAPVVRSAEPERYGQAVSTRHGRVIRMPQRSGSYPVDPAQSQPLIGGEDGPTPPHQAASH